MTNIDRTQHCIRFSIPKGHDLDSALKAIGDMGFKKAMFATEGPTIRAASWVNVFEEKTFLEDLVEVLCGNGAGYMEKEIACHILHQVKPSLKGYLDKGEELDDLPVTNDCLDFLRKWVTIPFSYNPIGNEYRKKNHGR